MKTKLFALIICIFIVLSCFVSVGAQNKTSSTNSEAKQNMRILGRVTDEDWSVGPEDAAITIIEYSDFQCPFCKDVSLFLIDYQNKHPEDVRLVYRHFPLNFHDKAVLAAAAANAAGDQGMFFAAADYLFENQSEWSMLGDIDAFTVWLIVKFQKFKGLDFDKWYLTFTDNERIAEVSALYDQVAATGIVTGTPTVFFNYIKVDDISSENLDKILAGLTSALH